MSLEKADQLWLIHIIMKKLEIFKGKIHLISLDFK